ncbi:MAG: hypothetical protein JOZ57_07235, partial [Abitibacteriaceae bacterium]|nr:hypothetical protein [Abditibacteriaceae bacterium]
MAQLRLFPPPRWWFVLLGLSSLLSGCGVVMRRVIVPFTGSMALQMPAALKTPGVKVGAAMVTKSVFIQGLQVGRVSDMATGQLDPAPAVQLGIAGANGAVFTNTQGVVQSAVTFAVKGDHVNIIDVEHDGVCEFLNRGSWSSEPWLLDHSGQVLWRYQGAAAADDTAPTTIRGTGKLDFVI